MMRRILTQGKRSGGQVIVARWFLYVVAVCTLWRGVELNIAIAVNLADESSHIVDERQLYVDNFFQAGVSVCCVLHQTKRNTRLPVKKTLLLIIFYTQLQRGFHVLQNLTEARCRQVDYTGLGSKTATQLYASNPLQLAGFRTLKNNNKKDYIRCRQTSTRIRDGDRPVSFAVSEKSSFGENGNRKTNSYY